MNTHITEAEMEIMRVVWASGRPITSREILAQMPQKKLTTVVTLAGRLIDKGILRSVKEGRSHSHRYSACITEEDYRRAQTRDFVANVHHGSAKSLLSALFDADGLTPEDIAELRRFLDRQADEI